MLYFPGPQNDNWDEGWSGGTWNFIHQETYFHRNLHLLQNIVVSVTYKRNWGNEPLSSSVICRPSSLPEWFSTLSWTFLCKKSLYLNKSWNNTQNYWSDPQSLVKYNLNKIVYLKVCGKIIYQTVRTISIPLKLNHKVIASGTPDNSIANLISEK